METTILPFVGRQAEIDKFYSLLSIRAQRNALYFQAEGGIGKTRLLRQLIAECRANPDWHIAPADNDLDPLIDFFELANRSISGLRHSLIERLGWDEFAEFSDSERQYREALSSASTISSSAVASLQRRNDELFFIGLERALRERQIFFFFDTFEVVQRRQVGRWLLDEFLPRSTGSLVIFAGRPPKPELPSTVEFYPLLPFSLADTQEYFQLRGWKIPINEQEALQRATGGRPLLIDMTMYLRQSPIQTANLTALDSLSPETFERELVNALVLEPAPEHFALQEMAYLKRRFEPRIFNQRQQGIAPAYPDIADYSTLHDRLLTKGYDFIIKYRANDQTLTLHDEVQRMIATHAPQLDKGWNALCSELYTEIVQGWYANQASSPTLAALERDLLRAEQLGYVLERDPVQGLELYKQYFAEARQHYLLDFNELIWGEIADQLAQNTFVGREYELCYAQAEWLNSVNQLSAAAELYRLIVNKYTDKPKDVIRKLDALGALGHAMLILTKYQEALRYFEQGVELATGLANKTWVSAFQHNRGLALQRMNQWEAAEQSFREAVLTAKDLQAREPLALAATSLGWLQAHMGNYAEAIANCQMAVARRREIFENPESERQAVTADSNPEFASLVDDPVGYYSGEGNTTRVASAYLRLADAYRYAGPGYRSRARQSYEKALTYLPKTGRYSLRSEILQGLANIYHDDGLDLHKRSHLNGLIGAASSYDAAFERFDEAIGLIRRHRLDRLLPKALHRVAHIFWQVGQLQEVDELQNHVIIEKLSKALHLFDLPEETSWLTQLGRLREAVPFAQLDTIGKAQRLFEVSSLEAEKIGDITISLDSLVQAGNVAFYRDRIADLEVLYNERPTSITSNIEAPYIALMELTRARLDLRNGNLSAALQRYKTQFPVLARSGGYGIYLLNDHLERLGEHLLKMPKRAALHFCDELIAVWEEMKLDADFPDLLVQMWEYRDQIAEKK